MSRPSSAPSVQATPDALERVLPHDLEAERAVLGCVLVHPETLTRVTRLTPRHFFREAHQRLWADIRAMDEAGVGIDFLTLKDHLRGAGQLDAVGGPAYLSALASDHVSSARVADHAAIVMAHAFRRDLILVTQQTTQAAYEQVQSPRELLMASEARLLDLAAHLDDRELLSMTARSGAVFDDLEALVARKGQLLGLDTGLSALNEQTLGWQAGDLIILASRPSMGKTTLALNTAIAAARQGHHVVLFSLEMRRRQLERRMLSCLSGVPLTKIQTGYVADADYAGLGEALKILERLTLHISDRSGQTIAEIRAACRRLKNQHGLAMVIIDYLQLMPGSLQRRGVTRNEELGDISSRLKWLADELSVPVMALSQLRRLSAARPTLEDLRDSGNLEQDADLVIFLHRKHHKQGGVTELLVEKQRNGPTGTIHVSLDRDIQRFTDAAAPVMAPEEDEAAADRRVAAIIRKRALAARRSADDE